MSSEEQGAPAEGAPAGGKHGKHGSWFQGKHRDAIIVSCSVVGVVIAFVSLRRSGGGGGAASSGGTGYLAPTSAAQAGLGTAGAVGGYNASAYQGLQTLLANQSDQLSTLESAVTNLSGAGAKPPTAIASQLTSPNYTGNYFHAGTGIGEVERDGSLFVFSPAQWQAAIKADPNAPAAVTDLGPNVSDLSFYSTAGNVKTAAQKTPGP